MKKILIIILILLPFVSFSQYELRITTNTVPIYPAIDADTLSICRDSMIIFKAVVTNNIDTIHDAMFSWDFDNGTLPLELNRDSVTWTYSEGGGYRVKLKVTKDADEWFTILPIRVAMEPNYSKTKVDLPEEHDGICLGSTAPLIGKAFPKVWEDEPVYEVIEEPYDFFEFDDSYNSNLTFDEFSLAANFATGNIDSIGLSIIHGDMGDLQISLSCENGNSVILKDYAPTNNLLLGDTSTNEAYKYYWSSSASATINSITTATDNIIPSAVYIPEQSFDNLIGCKLNGDWTIEINDNQELDSGFVYSWDIVFHGDVLPDVWTFKDTLKSCFWSGVNPGGTPTIFIGDTIVGTTSVRPEKYDNNEYLFQVINNWGCPQDTNTMVMVEKASFTATPEGGKAKLEVSLENTTTWASDKDWDFGDKSPTILIIDGDTISHEYLEKGEYDAILIATDDAGCSDTDTVTIIVTVEPFVIENIPNMFSPDNNDEINKVYKFSEENLKGIKEFELNIYNRWGQKVYETKDADEAIKIGWDGKNLLGLRCSPGIYFYVIKAEAKDPDQIYTQNGNTREEGENYKHEEIRGTIHLFW